MNSNQDLDWTFNTAHPECADGEIFLTNSTSKSYTLIGWKTKRLGNVAYCKNGDIIPRKYFPVFVKRAEVQLRIANNKQKDEETQ